jgi:hypothetical protein
MSSPKVFLPPDRVVNLVIVVSEICIQIVRLDQLKNIAQILRPEFQRDQQRERGTIYPKYESLTETLLVFSDDIS